MKSFSEKKKIAEEMKPIAKALGVNCRFCHVEADKGLRSGDFQIFTRKGDFAKKTMFPLAKKFFVDCSFCHAGKNQFTKAGMRALEDLYFIRNYNRKVMDFAETKTINCLTCHVLPEKKETNPFKKLKVFRP